MPKSKTESTIHETVMVYETDTAKQVGVTLATLVVLALVLFVGYTVYMGIYDSGKSAGVTAEREHSDERLQEQAKGYNDTLKQYQKVLREHKLTDPFGILSIGNSSYGYYCGPNCTIWR